MISLNNARIFLCTDDTDMRKSFSSLSGVVRKSMNLDPFSGYLFVFKNKRADRIKLMYFERDGMALWYKVLNKGTFKFPDLTNISSSGLEIEPSTLRLILDGIDLKSIRRQTRYHPLPDTEWSINPAARLSRDAYKPGHATEPSHGGQIEHTTSGVDER